MPMQIDQSGEQKRQNERIGAPVSGMSFLLIFLLRSGDKYAFELTSRCLFTREISSIPIGSFRTALLSKKSEQRKFLDQSWREGN
jgi:hypothetical protein